MFSEKDKDYLYHYQTFKFEENDTDPFTTCNARRKCLALTHQASLELCNNDETCFLLENNLRDYANIVDNKEIGGVNNYAQSILELVAGSTAGSDTGQWESSLPSIDPAIFINLMKPPECHNADENGFCQSAKITDEDINLLLANYNHNLSSSGEIMNKVRSGTSNTTALTPQTSFLCDEKKKEQEHGMDFDCGNSSNSHSRQLSALHRQTSESHQTAPNFAWKMDTVEQVVEAKFPGPAGISSVPSTNQLTRQGGNRNIASPSMQRSNDSSSLFITAHEELGNQNAKKLCSRRGGPGHGSNFGNQDYRSSRNASGYDNQGPGYSSGNRNYGSKGDEPVYQGYQGVKRTHGSRRGVMNKFVPPIRQNSEEDNMGGRQTWGGEQGSEAVDERLKNIDPKMVELIRSEIMDCGASVQWDDIAGLEFAKATIQEIVVWPLLRPDIFTGLRRPPRGILLFGPPGTGKTLIGKCIASQSCSTFFSISASSLTSKWIGDGEKMVRALFAVASCHQPAVVFIDEIDSLLTQRSDSEHESSRRIKTEFLVQLDGATTGEDDRTLIIGATNRPQELDEAARRRLVKRLYIPLPEFQARRQLVERLMMSERHCLTDENIEEISRLTEGYSGADMKNLCQEACLGPIRSLGMMQIKHIQPDQVREVSVSDFKNALTRVRASVSSDDLDVYIKWDKTFGSGGVGLS